MNLFETPEWQTFIFTIIFCGIILGVSGIITLYLYLKNRKNEEKEKT